MSLGPYKAEKDGRISYKGNKIFDAIKDIRSVEYPTDEVKNRVHSLHNDLMWKHIAKIDHRINISANEYFDGMGALFTALPMTTRMISSPGAVYGKEALNYTTDTCPITLKWFNLPKKAFLAESSQIYLELALLQKGVDHVYSIYNSFRKEPADATHLSEFHHIEYEGKVDQKKNLGNIESITSKIVNDVIEKNYEDLGYFVSEESIDKLKEISKKGKFTKITFEEALDVLHRNTDNRKYKKFTLKNFGSWEEVKVTEIYDHDIVAISEYPLLEVPFYHAMLDNSDPKVAQNSDIIWPGYRETIGSGHRVRNIQELEEKAKIFNLPREDYAPYLQSRRTSSYKPTSGFGLGWERLVQGLLEMPFIWTATQFPRGHTTMFP